MKIKFFLFGCVTMLGLLFCVFFMRDYMEKSELKQAVIEREAQKIHCPPPAKLQYEGWSKSGVIANCKIQHGQFVAVEGEIISMKGEYNMGKPSGEWIWFDRSGNVEKKELK